MFGGGSTDWCGQKTVCHGRTVVGGENGEVGWKVHRSPTGAGGVRGRSEKLLDWCVQLFLPPHAWRLPPCIKLPHPLLQQHFCFPVSSSHHRHAVHFTLPPASPPPASPTISHMFGLPEGPVFRDPCPSLHCYTPSAYNSAWCQAGESLLDK